MDKKCISHKCEKRTFCEMYLQESGMEIKFKYHKVGDNTYCGQFRSTLAK